jgi:flagella basal body P-ring formation protein FlgA
MKTASTTGREDRKECPDRRSNSHAYGQLFLFITLLILAMATPVQAFDITFRGAATVPGASITLAEIATINSDSELAKALAGQSVAASPDAGQKIVLDTHSISKKLINTLATPAEITWHGAPSVTVERSGNTLTAQKIQEIIEAYISERAKELPKAQYTFTPKDPPLPFLVPIGDIKWEVTPSNPELIGSNRFTLIGRIDNQVIKNFSVRGTLEAIALVAVAASSLQRDDLITAPQIQMEPRDLSDLRVPCLQLNQVVGKKLLRNIKAGAVVELTAIEFPPIVKKGGLVKILCQKDGLELTASGIAKTDGKQDQIIKVKNTSSDKEIFARVTAPGLVEVQI